MMGGAPKPLSRVMFDKYDQDGNGYISASELDYLCRDLGSNLSETEIGMAMRTLDRSGNGQIEYDEFIAWWRKGAARWAQLEFNQEELARLTQAINYFNHFDADRSGTISADEFGALHADLTRNGFTTQTKEECLAELDRSGDNLISFNEYLDYLERIGSLRVKVMPDA
jgi:calcium-binding protein CML